MKIRLKQYFSYYEIAWDEVDGGEKFKWQVKVRNELSMGCTVEKSSQVATCLAFKY